MTDTRTPEQKPTLRSSLITTQSLIEELLQTSADDIGPSLVEQMRICLELSEEALATEPVDRATRVLCELVKAIPVPKAQKAQRPYEEALMLAAEFEGRADFTINLPAVGG